MGLQWFFTRKYTVTELTANWAFCHWSLNHQCMYGIGRWTPAFHLIISRSTLVKWKWRAQQLCWRFRCTRNDNNAWAQQQMLFLKHTHTTQESNHCIHTLLVSFSGPVSTSRHRHYLAHKAFITTMVLVLQAHTYICIVHIIQICVQTVLLSGGVIDISWLYGAQQRTTKRRCRSVEQTDGRSIILYTLLCILCGHCQSDNRHTLLTITTSRFGKWHKCILVRLKDVLFVSNLAKSCEM